MASCPHCGRNGFASVHAMNGHLRACPRYEPGLSRGSAVAEPAYRLSLAQPGLSQGSADTVPLPGTPEWLATEERALATDLRVRKLEREKARLDAEDRAAAEAERRARAAEAAAAAAEREAADRARRRQAKLAMAKVWSGLLWRTDPGISLSVKADALAAIEQELGAVPALEDVPDAEVLTRAEAVWDRLVRPLVEAREAQTAAARARRGEASAPAPPAPVVAARAPVSEPAPASPAPAAAARPVGVELPKDRLLRRGMAFAAEDLADWPAGERQAVLSDVWSELASALRGDETEAELADLVEEILDDLLGEDEDDEDDLED